MPAETPFYRVRWTLRARGPCHLHTHQNAILYAVLCDAARDGSTGPHMPDGLLLDAPEVGRIGLEAGEEFAFGATLIEADPEQAARRLHAVSAGLSRLGATRPKKPVALGGNFDLVNVEDLVSGQAVSPGEPFTPLPRAVLIDQTERLAASLGTPVALRFVSPLRLERPGAEMFDGHRFADGTCLNVGQLLRAVQKRLAVVGIRRTADGDAPFDDSAVTLLANRLRWADVWYGTADRRKVLGGAVGTVVVAVHDPVALAALVWGQYTRVGRNLHFGFGRYTLDATPNGR